MHSLVNSTFTELHFVQPQNDRIPLVQKCTYGMHCYATAAGRLSESERSVIQCTCVQQCSVSATE